MANGFVRRRDSVRLRSWRSLALVASLCCTIVACSDSGAEKNNAAEKSDVVIEKLEPESVAESTPTDRTQPDEAKQSTTEPEPSDRASMIAKVEQFSKDRDFDSAAKLLQRALTATPGDIELQFRYANAKASAGDVSSAIEILEAIPSDYPQAGIAAIGQSADMCLAIGRFADAESKYQQILQRAPGAALADRQLAYLMNRQGRRHEAAVHIRKLCRKGDVREDELHSLMSLSDAIWDDPRAQTPRSTSQRMYFPIGPGGVARKLFTDQKYREAADELKDAVELRTKHRSLDALYGRALIEAQDDAAFLNWLSTAGPEVEAFAEYWAAVGTYLVMNQRFPEAVRALGEALQRDPTDARSLKRIYQALLADDKEDAAKRCFEQFTLMRSVTLASGRIGSGDNTAAEAFSEIVVGLQQLHRPLESITWELFEAFKNQRPRAQIDALAERRTDLASSAEAFGIGVSNRLGIPLQEYPIPNLDQDMAAPELSTSDDDDSPNPLVVPHFENVAGSIGLDHVYWVASKPVGSEFSIYQSVGGGVAVVDYDLDGAPDLYFAQGAADPPSYVGTKSSLLYRNVDRQLQDATYEGGVTEKRYSIGVTRGDLNQDGFPDLVVSNLGANTIFINHGDGTFVSQTTDSLDDTNVMTTSLAIADVTGDSLPDLVELNYADDTKLARKPERNPNGELIEVGPFDYRPGMDRILVNDGRGNRDVRLLNEADQSQSTGLGLVVADFDGASGNEIFIGNDMHADHLWRHDGREWSNLAVARGCAYSSSGSRTATMGIAAADFDGSGTLDLHLTNYENQPATLYLNRGGVFSDRAIAYRLVEASNPVLGFGCQSLDYDGDGRWDLVVSNGHVEDLGEPKKPFRQPMQLFVNRGNHFDLTTVDDSSGYFADRHVGRALAKLDWDRDGRQDLVVTHLEAPSALLVNRTENPRHWIRVRLVGTESERDAVGAKVELTIAGQTWTQWVTAGDGYLCRNERDLFFSFQPDTVEPEIRVTWPNGREQMFAADAVDQQVLAVEGLPELTVLSASE